jgi:hypothetical protein
MTTHAPTATSQPASTASKKQQLINRLVEQLKAAKTPDDVQRVVDENQLFGVHLRSFTVQEESIIVRAIRDARARAEKDVSKKLSKKERIDLALRAALYMHDYSEGQWAKLIEDGATNAQIWHALIDEFKSGFASETDDGIDFAVRGLSPDAQHIPSFWLDASTHMTKDKPTLKGDALVKRVREVLSIPQLKSFHEKEAPPMEGGEAKGQLIPTDAEFDTEMKAAGWCMKRLEGRWYAVNYTISGMQTPIVDTPREARDEAVRMQAAFVTEAKPKTKPGDVAHEFKPTTSRNGKCSVCNKGRDTEHHRAWTAEQRERVSAGGPTQTAEGWREKAAATLAKAAGYRANPHAGKTLTDARQRDWEGKLRSATDHRRWGLTMEAVAAAVEAGTLPPVLNGLTNQYQVRQLMDCVIEGRKLPAHGSITSMGPTIKTPEEFVAAVKAISPLVPIVEPYTVEGELQGWYGREGITGPGVRPAPAATAAAVNETPDGDVSDALRLSVEDERATQTLRFAGAAQPPEVFYALDLFEDGAYDITYLGRDNSVDYVPEDQTAVIAINASGEKRILSKHNLTLTDEEIFAKYGADPRLVAPHAYIARDGEVDPCCILSKDASIHDLTPAPETPSDALQAQAAAVTTAPAPKPFTAEVEVVLNDHDIALKARAAAVLASEIADLEAEKKENDAVYKKKIGGKEEERDKLLSEIGRGRATLELKVYEHRDYEAKTVETRRVDDDAVVKTRAMNPREYQQPLPSL